MMRGSMSSLNRRHRWLMGVYFFGAAVAVTVAWFPSFFCRAGSAVLLVGFGHMIWQRRSALREGFDAQVRLSRSVLYYVPFLTGANLVWMGLPIPVEPIAKAWSHCAFLAGTVLLLAGTYIYNLRTIGRMIDETGSLH